MANRGFGALPNRRVPSNPKYANTAAKLDTGPNMRKVLDKYQGSGPNAHKKHRDEFFVRLRPQTLGRLLESLVESEESVYALGKIQESDTSSVVSHSVVPDSAVATGSGEGNILIFDLRPFEEFEQCHVYGARHLDPATLNRSTNNLPRDVYFYKGPIECDKMVVLYDEDGKLAAAAGNKFVESGVENTYVVGGGFITLCATCPHILVGHPPSAETLATLLQRAGIKVSSGGASTARSEAGAMSARCSTTGSVRTQATHLTSSVAGSPQPRAWK